MNNYEITLKYHRTASLNFNQEILNKYAGMHLDSALRPTLKKQLNNVQKL